jgi:3-methyladenine DNA glycosylase Mpg
MNRKRKVQPPPNGFVWAQDYCSEDGSVVIPGIATRLGISHSTYRKWRMRDQGPATVIVGKKVAARIEAIEAYLAGLEQAALDAAQAESEAAEHDSRPAELRHTPRKRLTSAVA